MKRITTEHQASNTHTHSHTYSLPHKSTMSWGCSNQHQVGLSACSL